VAHSQGKSWTLEGGAATTRGKSAALGSANATHAAHASAASCDTCALGIGLAFRESVLLVRIHFIIEMIRWTGLAPWELEILFPGDDEWEQRGAGKRQCHPRCTRRCCLVRYLRLGASIEVSGPGEDLGFWGSTLWGLQFGVQGISLSVWGQGSRVSMDFRKQGCYGG